MQHNKLPGIVEDTIVSRDWETEWSLWIGKTWYNPKIPNPVSFPDQQQHNLLLHAILISSASGSDFENGGSSLVPAPQLSEWSELMAAGTPLPLSTASDITEHQYLQVLKSPFEAWCKFWQPPQACAGCQAVFKEEKVNGGSPGEQGCCFEHSSWGL